MPWEFFRRNPIRALEQHSTVNLNFSWVFYGIEAILPYYEPKFFFRK